MLSVISFTVELRKLTLNCDFKDFLAQALRDRFACGLQNNSIRRRLLAERKLTLKSAIELAKTMENADLETQIIATDIKTENVSAMNNATRKCYRCNSTKHLANAKCNNCRMKGHISKACRNRTHQTDPSLEMPAYKKTATPKPTSNILKQKQTLPTNDVEENIDSNLDEDSSSFYIHKINPTKPLCVTLDIQDSTIKFEIDTSLGITLISEREYCTHFQNLQLTDTKMKVQTYANKPLKLLGKLIIDVSYENKIYNRLPLCVIKGSGVNLLGRNWMALMRLNWENIFEQLQEHNPYKEKVSCVNIQKELETVTNKYPNVFSEKLGTVKGAQDKINVIPNSRPKFMKAWTVPFAMKPAVELEMERMDNEGILKSVPFSEWASSIVIVPKNDGRLRICGDYKQTVNPCLDNDIFPQPTPEELFSKLNVGKKFSKIDLS